MVMMKMLMQMKIYLIMKMRILTVMHATVAATTLIVMVCEVIMILLLKLNLVYRLLLVMLIVGSHYRPIINYQLDPKGEEAIILYTHMHFITNKFHLYHSDYILQEI